MAPQQHNLLTQPEEVPFIDHLMPVALEVERDLELLLQGSGVLPEAMRYAVLGGGKRFRAFLTVTIADAYNAPRANSIRVASALECVQSYSLVHDDLPAIDDGDTRRGKPSCHVQYSEATAILVGDALIPLAFQILSSPEAHSDPAVRSDLVSVLSKAIGSNGMVLGQMMDLGLEGPIDTLARLTATEQFKTGELMAAACQLGGVLGGADDNELQILRQYGLKLGLIYQITDDILDAEGDRNQLGKPTGQDNGKNTFVNLMGFDGAKAKAEQYIDETLQSLTSLTIDCTLLEDAAYFALSRIK